RTVTTRKRCRSISHKGQSHENPRDMAAAALRLKTLEAHRRAGTCSQPLDPMVELPPSSESSGAVSCAISDAAFEICACWPESRTHKKRASGQKPEALWHITVRTALRPTAARESLRWRGFPLRRG